MRRSSIKPAEELFSGEKDATRWRERSNQEYNLKPFSTAPKRTAPQWPSSPTVTLHSPRLANALHNAEDSNRGP
jgi:hypothetical protein